MEFLSLTNREISDPSAIGLGGSDASPLDDSSKIDRTTNDQLLRQRFEDALIRGDERECRKILIQWYGFEQSFAQVADDLIAPTFRKIGQLWHASSIEIFQERRACEICNRLTNEFRRVIIEPLPTAPKSIGCTSTGDHYCVPGQLIEVVLREAGWRATNIGSNVPLGSLAVAVRQERPKLVWLSVSHIENKDAFVRELHEFCDSIPQEVSLVVGGRALTDDIRPRLRYTAHCDTMSQLSTLAKSIRSSMKQVRTHPI